MNGAVGHMFLIQNNLLSIKGHNAPYNFSLLIVGGDDMMYWIEQLQEKDEWDENSEMIWVLVAVIFNKNEADKYRNKEGYRVVEKGLE